MTTNHTTAPVIEYLTMTGETRNFLSAALLEIVNRIEACGASIELTRASCLASDLKHALGDRWNEPSRTALEIVRRELSQCESNRTMNISKIYLRDETETQAAVKTLEQADELTRLRAEIAELRAEREAMAKQEPIAHVTFDKGLTYIGAPCDVGTALFASPVPIPEALDGFLKKREQDSFSCKQLVADLRAMLAAAHKHPTSTEGGAC